MKRCVNCDGRLGKSERFHCRACLGVLVTRELIRQRAAAQAREDAQNARPASGAVMAWPRKAVLA